MEPLPGAVPSPMALIERARPLDRVVTPVARAVRAVLRSRSVADALHGVWLGHPLHPALVLIPAGTLASASLLDAVDGDEGSTRLLLATGLVTAVPTAAAGLADWSEMDREQQRVGLLHAAANVVGLACYGASLVARTSAADGRARARALSLAGLGALSVGGYLGGHVAYRQSGGANHGEEVPRLVGPGWHDLCAVDDLPPTGSPTVRHLDDVPLLVVRRDRDVDVLSDRCSHLAGPLHEGSVSDDGSCITCPWHGSTFRLRDGSVVTGPATSPQHAFDVRVVDGRVQVRLPAAG